MTGAAPLLQAENGAVGQTITGYVINSMPLKSRDWASLAQLSAGVVTAPKGQPSSLSGTTDSAFFSVNGVNLWQNDFRLNGINDNIEFYGGSSVDSNAAITPPPDAIQQLKLQTGNFTAEFGHSTGGVVNAAIKSGTNQFHGDAGSTSATTIWTRTHISTRPRSPSIAAMCSGGPSAVRSEFQACMTGETRRSSSLTIRACARSSPLPHSAPCLPPRWSAADSRTCGT